MITMNQEELKEKASTFPNEPGVYIWRDVRGVVLYVGKAQNLKHRILSYFLNKIDSETKTKAILTNAVDIDYVVTRNEMEALVVESNLVKLHKPRYNTRLKDDKAYPFLKLTMKEKFPRALLARRYINDGSRYYGPLSGTSVYAALEIIRNIFHIRQRCKIEINKIYKRACMYYQIKQCMGPCIGAVTEREYRKVVKDVIAFLEGKSGQVLVHLKKDMEKASEQMHYEKAAFIRDQINNIEQFIADQKVVSSGLQDEDFVALARKGGHAVTAILMVRGGNLIGKENFVLLAPISDTDDVVLGDYLKQYYNLNQNIPRRINIPFHFPDEKVMVEWLTEKRGKKVTIKLPDRGERRRLVELANQNASISLDEHLKKESTEEQVLKSALAEVKERLELSRIPHRIECYDVSNIGRDNISRTATASRVVFINGKPSKDYYRRFRIKTVEEQDDYAMMEEVLTRRLKHYNPDAVETDERIDLMLIDGGKGHLGVAIKVAQTLGVSDFDIASLAKQEEEVFRPDRAVSIVIPKGSPALFLLQRIRDEAHRFALDYQRKLRSRQLKLSVLDSIPGLGPRRKEELIRKWGSIERIASATPEEIAQTPGIGFELAKLVIEKLKANDMNK